MDAKKTIINGVSLPVLRARTVIVGSGTAGLNCADRMFDEGVGDVLIVTSNLHGGTSYCSGSDKQTYYKMSNFGDTADSPIDMAHSLFDGGCMHGDLAYIESLYSLPAFYHLVENGVPFPCNQFGAFVGYKTDHDPRRRATSAGPKTSRLMVETSLAKVREKGIPILDKMTVVRIVTADNKVCGLVAINEAEVNQPSLGITLFQVENVILATGGPGELYASSVYPEGQVSLHGVAIEAGASAVNLGESQFGLTSTKFRWNLSGTYQQVIPSYFSMGDDGRRHNFLAKYFRNLPEMASAIFLKGYQWPFSANRASDFGSSLVDIAVADEAKAGRRVFMDFTQNPSSGDEVFDIQALTPDAANYLNRSLLRQGDFAEATSPEGYGGQAETLQETPYERLAFMNPDSIEIYAEHGIDLHEPLEIAVSFQHNNGGLWIDANYQTSIEGLFAIGEVAGSHGVARPGGSALNSGQVGGIRVAQCLGRRKGGPSGDCIPLLRDAAVFVMSESAKMAASVWNQADCRAELQKRMTEVAGFIRKPDQVERALSHALAANDVVPGTRDRHELVRAWETRNLLLTHAAFLKSIHAYLEAGGGSRGAYLVVGEGAMGRHGEGATGEVRSAKGVLCSFVKERLEDRSRRVMVTGPNLEISWEDVRPLPTDDSWFETVWAESRKESG